MATIGNLVARIGLDSSGFQKGLSSVKSGLAALPAAGAKLSSVGAAMSKGVTLPALAAAAAIGVAASAAADWADGMVQASQRTGMTLKPLQELSYVANQTGVEFNAVGSAVAVFTRNIPQIAAGGNEAADAFSKLGINLRNGNGDLRGVGEMFPEIIAGLSSMKNETERNALATQLFGRQAFELIPLMAAGSEEIARLTEQANALGLVMGDDSVNALESFGDQMDTLKLSAGAVMREFVAGILPVLSDVLVPILQNGVIPAIRSVAQWFGGLSTGVKTAMAAFAGAIAVLGPFLAALGAFASFLPAISSGLTMIGGILTGPFVAGIALAVGAVMAFANNWLGFRDIVMGVWNAVSGVVSTVMKIVWTIVKTVINAIIGNFVGLGNIVMLVVNGIREAFGPAFDWIREKAGKVFGGIAKVLGILGGKAAEAARGIAKALLPDDEDMVGKASTLGGRVMQAYASGFKDYVGMAGDALKGMFSSAHPAAAAGAGMKSMAGMSVSANPQLAAANKLAEVEAEVTKQKKEQKELVDSIADTQSVVPSAPVDPKQSFGSSVKEMIGSRAADAAGMSGVVQAVAQFGPLGALLPFINRALEKLAPTIEAVVEPLMMVVDIVAKAIAPILKAVGVLLQPVFMLIQALAKSLAPIIQTIIIPLFKAMWPVMKALAIAMTWLGEIVFRIADGIATAIGWLIKAIGAAVKALPFDNGAGEKIKRAGQAMMDMFDGSVDNMKKTREELKKMSFDDSMADTAKAADKVTASLTNVPNGVKIALARFDAASGVSRSSMTGGAPTTSTSRAATQAQTVTHDNRMQVEKIEIIAADTKTGKGLLDQIMEEARRKARRAAPTS